MRQPIPKTLYYSAMSEEDRTTRESPRWWTSDRHLPRRQVAVGPLVEYLGETTEKETHDASVFFFVRTIHLSNRASRSGTRLVAESF